MKVIEEKILALSWRQPYAELMLHGKIETRTWKTNYRGLVLICASKVFYDTFEKIGISGMKQFNRLVDIVGDKNSVLQHGKAIAIGRLVDCRPMTKDDEDACFVEFREGLYCHVYEEVQKIKPFEWRGSQRWKIVSDEVKQKIKII